MMKRLLTLLAVLLLPLCAAADSAVFRVENFSETLPQPNDMTIRLEDDVWHYSYRTGIRTGRQVQLEDGTCLLVADNGEVVIDPRTIVTPAACGYTGNGIWSPFAQWHEDGTFTSFYGSHPDSTVFYRAIPEEHGHTVIWNEYGWQAVRILPTGTWRYTRTPLTWTAGAVEDGQPRYRIDCDRLSPAKTFMLKDGALVSDRYTDLAFTPIPRRTAAIPIGCGSAVRKASSWSLPLTEPASAGSAALCRRSTASPTRKTVCLLSMRMAICFSPSSGKAICCCTAPKTA